MAIIKVTTSINASIENCFNLSRSVDVHLQSMQNHGEQVVAGTSHGMMNLHDTVTWKAWHLGLPWKMTVKITELNYPIFFSDRMITGPFKLMHHYHSFNAAGQLTIMTDEFVFRSPGGWLGKLVDYLFLKRYMRKLLTQRNLLLKQLAEHAETEQYQVEKAF